MQNPENTLKTALRAGHLQRGIWLTSASPVLAELAGGVGFDWCLIDGEHGPNTVAQMLPQLQALAATGTSAVVRVAAPEVWMIKQALDLGVQTVLVPMVETAGQAQELVRACRYPPEGTRGVGYGVSRAGGFGQFENYGPTADAQICLLVQVETKTGLENLDEIIAVDGVDGVFIGPADLSASMGYLGQTMHPEMQSTILRALKRISDSGKAAGILTTDEGMIRSSLDAGARFIAVAMDVALLLDTAKATVTRWKSR